MNKYAVLFFAVVFCCSSAFAQSSVSVCADGSCINVNASSATGAGDYAVKLNQGRLFRHDPSFRGAEVIFKSSGIATEADARRWWMNSPPHRKLLLAGAIQDIQCVGSVCVGRGIQGTAQTINAAASFRPFQKLRSRLRGCR